MTTFIEILSSIPLILLFSFLGLRQTQILTNIYKKAKNLKMLPEKKVENSLEKEELEKILHGNYTCFKDEF